jgi:hypothetical protein
MWDTSGRGLACRRISRWEDSLECGRQSAWPSTHSMSRTTFTMEKLAGCGRQSAFTRPEAGFRLHSGLFFAPSRSQFLKNPKTLRSLEIPLPPLSLQQRFVRVVHQFEHLRAQQREAQRQAEHLFQTLLHRAFRGVDLTDFENLSGLGMRSS